MSWTDQPMSGIALATTSPDPATARLVAFASRTVNDGRNDPAEVLPVKTPVRIPVASTAHHRFTNDLTDDLGFEPDDVLIYIHDVLADAAANDRPVVAFNATWIFQVLATEARHAGVKFTIPQGLAIIDPLIIDTHYTPQRRAGNRTLPALLNAWHINFTHLGTPEVNLNYAMRLAWTMCRSHPQLRNTSPAELHRKQAQWKAEQDLDREVHLDSRGRLFPAGAAA